MVFIVVDN